MVPQILLGAGLALVGYGVVKSRAINVGSKVVVSALSLVSPEGLSAKVDAEVIVEVMKVEGDQLTGRVLGMAGDSLLAPARIGMTVTFPKSAVKRKLAV